MRLKEILIILPTNSESKKTVPHSLYANYSTSMLNFHEVLLVVLVSTTFPILKNRKSVAIICVRHFYVMQWRRWQFTLFRQFFFLPFFLLDIFEIKELDVNELTRWMNILRICTHSTQLYWEFIVVKALTYRNFMYSLVEWGFGR